MFILSGLCASQSLYLTHIRVNGHLFKNVQYACLFVVVYNVEYFLSHTEFGVGEG